MIILFYIMLFYLAAVSQRNYLEILKVADYYFARAEACRGYQGRIICMKEFAWKDALVNKISIHSTNTQTDKMR